MCELHWNDAARLLFPTFNAIIDNICVECDHAIWATRYKQFSLWSNKLECFFTWIVISNLCLSQVPAKVALLLCSTFQAFLANIRLRRNCSQSQTQQLITRAWITSKKFYNFGQNPLAQITLFGVNRSEFFQIYFSHVSKHPYIPYLWNSTFLKIIIQIEIEKVYKLYTPRGQCYKPFFVHLTVYLIGHILNLLSEMIFLRMLKH